LGGLAPAPLDEELLDRVLAQAEIDHPSLPGDGEADPPRDGRVGSGPVLLEHLDRQDLGVRRHAGDADPVTGAPGDDAGDMRSMAVVVDRDHARAPSSARALVRAAVGGVPREIRAADCDQPWPQVGVAEIDTRVHDRDAHAAASGEAPGPRHADSREPPLARGAGVVRPGRAAGATGAVVVPARCRGR
jgi:hypothetical protein